jgi:hypothetical protein
MPGYSFASDIQRRIEKDFGSEAPAVIGELEEFIESFRAMARTHPGDRVIRCIVHLADGRREDLAHYIKAALGDPRDVMYWAEYDRDARRTHDFSMAFPGVV